MMMMMMMMMMIIEQIIDDDAWHARENLPRSPSLSEDWNLVFYKQDGGRGKSRR